MDYTPPNVEIHEEVNLRGFQVQPNTAQYGGSDYMNAIRVERGISLEEAFAIAMSDPSIAYFVYLKGGQMILPVASKPPADPLGLIIDIRYRGDQGDLQTGLCRTFSHGDTVFFSKDGLWLGSAPGLADTYIKQ